MLNTLAIGFGTTELIIILVIVLVLFGAGKIPQVGEALGKGIRNFKRSTSGDDEIDITKKDSSGELPGAEKKDTEIEDAKVVEEKS